MKSLYRAPAFAAALVLFLAVSTGPGDLWAGADRTFAGIAAVSDDPDGGSGSGDAGSLEKEIQGLIEELKALGKDAGEKLRKDVLPRVREEIRKLREKLRELEADEDPPETRNI